MKTDQPKQILIVPPGSLTEADKLSSLQAGFVVLEMEDPSKAVVLMPSSPLLGADDILMSAISGILKGGYDSTKVHMVNELCRRIMLADAKGKESA